MEWDHLLNSERPRPSTSAADHREEFERDYDRTVFSSPVKRLQDKTQVFPLEPHDSVRTRLTHSLEVSSVARGLATRVCKDFLHLHLNGEQNRQIEAIAATCGLIHDLGNPPFGHSGEDAIREWFKKKFKLDELISLLGGRSDLAQDFLNFEGNAQTLRIVARLQILADFNGLNLTYGTLSALCKYTAASTGVVKNGDHAKSKPGYFFSEGDLVQNIRDKTGTGDARNPITFLVEAADDIVYSVADIEDGVKKRILSWDDLWGLLLLGPEAEAAAKTVKAVLKAKERILSPSASPDELEDDVHAAAFRTAAIGNVLAAASQSFKENYEAIMAGEFTDELVKRGSAAPFVKLLKNIGKDHIYGAPSNLKLELMGRTVIQDLMTLFWEGAKTLPAEGTIEPRKFAGKLQKLLSKAYRQVYENSAQTKAFPLDYLRLQLVTDYVCGMTDSFAQQLHADLTNG